MFFILLDAENCYPRFETVPSAWRHSTSEIVLTVNYSVTFAVKFFVNTSKLIYKRFITVIVVVKRPGYVEQKCKSVFFPNVSSELIEKFIG